MNPLIEFHLRFWLSERIVIRFDFNRSVFPGRGACRGACRRPCRLADVLKNRPDRRCLDDEGDDFHFGTAVPAGERTNLEQAGDERGPQSCPELAEG